MRASLFIMNIISWLSLGLSRFHNIHAIWIEGQFDGRDDRTWSSSPFLINKTLFIWNNYRLHREIELIQFAKRHFIAMITNSMGLLRRKLHSAHAREEKLNESMHKIIKNETNLCNWSV